jgi:hypothetical protein
VVLADAGNILEQYVTLRKHRHQNTPDDNILTNDDLADLIDDFLHLFATKKATSLYP